MASKKHYITVPATTGDQSAELLARFTYTMKGGADLAVIVSQLPGHPVCVSEATTRYRMGDIDAYQLAAAKGDYAIAAGMVIDHLRRKYGGAKIIKAIENAPKYKASEDL